MYACREASRVIAISGQTKADLMEFYRVPEERISVCYQGCDPSFQRQHTADDVKQMKTKYMLPQDYFLYVGSVIERKNLMGIAQAIRSLKGKLDLPLVVLGDGTGYKKEVKEYLRKEGLEQQVIWLNETHKFAFADLPAPLPGRIGAAVPFHGSKVSAFPSWKPSGAARPLLHPTAAVLLKPAATPRFYVDPFQPAAIANAMEQVVADEVLRADMQQKGILHAQLFTLDKCAAAVMNVYENI